MYLYKNIKYNGFGKLWKLGQPAKNRQLAYITVRVPFRIFCVRCFQGQALKNIFDFTTAVFGYMSVFIALKVRSF